MSEQNEAVKSDLLNEDKKIKQRKPWIAGLLNFLNPGLGYFYGGRFKLGLLTALIYPLILLLIFFISVKLPQTINIIFFILSLLSVTYFLTVSSYKFTKKNLSYTDHKNRIPLLIIFWICAGLYMSPVVKTSYKTYKLHTGSMANTLLIKDYLIASMSCYTISDPFLHNKIIRVATPERNEVVIYLTNDLDDEDERVPYVKRIVGIPGDTIKIEFKNCFINGVKEKNNDLYIYDNINRPPNFYNPRIYPKGSGWNEDQYGPLYIPRKNDIIRVDTSNIKLWKQIILSENTETNKVTNDEAYLESILQRGAFVVNHNYYFMMGDNRNNSLDSRFNGLVKEEDIIGKPEMIYWSKDISRIGKKVQ